MAEDIDPLAILAALDLAAPRAVTAVSGGWDTSLWRVDNGDRAFALRVFRPDQAEMCAREAVVMRALARAGLPVPDVVAEGSGLPRPALLIEWCNGTTVLGRVRQRPMSVWQLGSAMGRALADIHAVRVPDALAAAVPEWTPGGDPHRASGNLPGAVQDLPPALHTEVRRLTRARRALLHLDYHPLNVMCQGPRITGVLDWANARLGDPRADLARTITLLRLAPTPPGTPLMLDLGARMILEAAWRAGYRAGCLGAGGARSKDHPFADLDVFCVVAATMMERDLRPKLGRPGIWLTERHLARMRRWTARRQRRLLARLDRR